MLSRQLLDDQPNGSVKLHSDIHALGDPSIPGVLRSPDNLDRKGSGSTVRGRRGEVSLGKRDTKVQSGKGRCERQPRPTVKSDSLLFTRHCHGNINEADDRLAGVTKLRDTLEGLSQEAEVTCCDERPRAWGDWRNRPAISSGSERDRTGLKDHKLESSAAAVCLAEERLAINWSPAITNLAWPAAINQARPSSYNTPEHICDRARDCAYRRVASTSETIKYTICCRCQATIVLSLPLAETSVPLARLVIFILHRYKQTAVDTSTRRWDGEKTARLLVNIGSKRVPETRYMWWPGSKQFPLTRCTVDVRARNNLSVLTHYCTCSAERRQHAHAATALARY
ncbi:hypothetical protein J6590_055366 [Homalodisca vitripennis]|nr:hypothetical protein J6590_055366 [Homalodisca vitripennis]